MLANAMLINSEGQNVALSFGYIITQIDYIISHTKSGSKVFIILDGIDSGVSVDIQKTYKKLFIDHVIPDAKDKGIELYIILGVNNYEFAKYEEENKDIIHCIDIKNGKKVIFKSYDRYSNYICKMNKEWDIN